MLTLTKPYKFEDREKWTVYIVGEDGFLTGKEGVGNSPEQATKKAKAKINELKSKKNE